MELELGGRALALEVDEGVVDHHLACLLHLSTCARDLFVGTDMGVYVCLAHVECPSFCLPVCLFLSLSLSFSCLYLTDLGLEDDAGALLPHLGHQGLPGQHGGGEAQLDRLVCGSVYSSMRALCEHAVLSAC